jgi:YesN/AraC family two-component response regulator
MGGMDGIETMMNVRKLHADASVIIVTAYATVDTAITAMKEGAQEYIVKPCNPEEISLLVTRIIKVKNLQRENALLRKRLEGQYRFQDLISKSPQMQKIFRLAEEVAKNLGAMLACSRPVVDRNWLSKEKQVGISGKTVKPKVYIAIGMKWYARVQKFCFWGGLVGLAIVFGLLLFGNHDTFVANYNALAPMFATKI